MTPYHQIIAIDHEARAASAEARAKGDLALHKLDGHERICAVRYEAIQTAIDDMKAAVRELGHTYSGGINRVHDRIDAGQKRLVAGLAAVALLLAGGLGTVVFFMITTVWE